MTAIEHFETLERRAAVARAAYRIVGHAIDDWLTDYAASPTVPMPEVPVEVRVELERIRDAMRAAGAPPETPE